jgi:sugar/nucleoside kinase (ribokinase family)
MFDVVCLGILVADVIARPVDALPGTGTLGLVENISLRGGGCALNTATALATLGRTVAVVGKVGLDTFGDFLIGLLDERSIDRRGVIRDPAVPTSATVVLVGNGGERTFLHVKGANSELRVDELDRELLFAARFLHIAGALVLDALDGDPCAAVLADAKRHGVRTSLDTVWDADGAWQRVVPCLPFVDLFAPNLAEARAITGEHDVDAAAARLLQLGAGEVVVKLGSNGCYIGGKGLVNGIEVNTVDATGAGDAFCAGLLHGALEGWPIERSCRLANATGALATTAIGASEGLRDLHATLAIAGLE